jgi:hypothetical protein
MKAAFALLTLILTSSSAPISFRHCAQYMAHLQYLIILIFILIYLLHEQILGFFLVSRAEPS